MNEECNNLEKYLDKMPPSIEYVTKKIQVGNYELAYWDEGNENKEVICFVHGWTAGKYDWIFQIEEFKKDFRCIAHDHRSHGESERKDEPVTLQDLADDLYKLLNQLKIEKIHLVGHSMGGFVAIMFALKYQEMLNKLILVGTSPKFEFSEEGYETIEKMGYFEFAKIMGKFTDIPLRKRPSELKNYYKALEKWELEQKRNVPNHVAINFLKSFNGLDVTERMKEIKVETLVIFGKEDKVISTGVHAKLTENIPNFTLKLIDGSGHSPTREQIPTFNKILREFLH